MSNVQSEEKDKVEPFFHKLNKLAADVENGVKEVQNKISLPKSDLPENSALIVSVQLLDSLVELKKEMNNTEEELDKTENSRQDFIDSFEKAVKDTERKIDELECTLKKYGYIPWKSSQPGKEENTNKNNSENETTEEKNVDLQTTDALSVQPTDQEKPDTERSSTPRYSSRSLTYILRNSTNKLRNGSSRYNVDGVTPQLKLRSSCRRQPIGQLTPVCFSNDVVCTPGLFIPFQQKGSKNANRTKPSFYGSTFFAPNQYANEMENLYRNQQSPQFYEEDVTVELFKKMHFPPSLSCQDNKESITPEEPVLHSQHIIEGMQKNTVKNISRREEVITPEEPVLYAQQLLEEIRKTTKRNRREESITPEEPVLYAQQLLDEIRRSTKKNVIRRGESITPEEPVLYSQHLIEEIRRNDKKNFQTRIPIKDNDATPKTPELKSLLYLKKHKSYRSFLQ